MSLGDHNVQLPGALLIGICRDMTHACMRRATMRMWRRMQPPSQTRRRPSRPPGRAGWQAGPARGGAEAGNEAAAARGGAGVEDTAAAVEAKP